MLETLLKIGEWQKEGISEWDRFLDKPKPATENKKGEPIKNYIAGIVFDLDTQDVYLNRDSLKEYDEDKDPKALKAIKIQGGNNKSIYATAEPNKLNQIFKTFFGKPDKEDTNQGELSEAIHKDFYQFKHTLIDELAKQVLCLRQTFLNKVTKDDKIDFKAFFSSLELGSNENLVLVFAQIKSTDLGFPEPFPIAQIKEYEDFLIAKFFDVPTTTLQQKEKLCYASGEKKQDVGELNLPARYSLNKMFVTETKNYASFFDKNAFSLNYQISLENQEKLDLASDFLLNR